MTKPRSEIRAEASREGLTLPEAAEERTRFFEEEEVQQQRLIALIKTRAEGSYRDPNYRIGGGDELEINVFDVPELNLNARVRESGFVSLPLVGGVKVLGMTEQEIVDELKKRLGTYVRQPEVNVFISHYGSQKVAVVGAVRKPGTYSLKKGANSILELVSQAGGIGEKAGSFVNFIPAEVSGVSAANDVEARARLALAAEESVVNQNTGIEIGLDRIMGTSGGIPLEIPVRGGDMVIVPEAGKVMIEGEVEKAGAVELGQQMSLLGALAAAGGITYGAKIDEVEVIRDLGSKDAKGHLIVNLEQIAKGEERDIRLKNGDIVRVPSDSGRRMTQDTWETITNIMNFGVGGNVNLVP